MRKKILILINSDIYVRNYLETNAFDKLIKNFDCYFVAFSGDVFNKKKLTRKIKKNFKSLVNMDELELLKSKWQEGNQELPKLSYNDIYKMRHNKSASIVKWIFIISVCELVFWIVLGFLSPESNKELLVQIGLQNTLTILYGLHYVVIAVFLVLFYLNKKNIKTTDTVKNLMHSIIKTRKTVSYFVIYNVVSTALI